MTIAVLFARQDSIYKSIDNCDVFDIERDARSFDYSKPVIAHPPCRAWGRLRAFAKPRPNEKGLALFAVNAVRKCGGVLEHPEASSLWLAAGLPRPRSSSIDIDQYGGWTFSVAQNWFGHRAEKKTWLYIVGLKPAELPDFSLSLQYPSHVIAQSKRKNRLPQVSIAERERTPEAFAHYLIKIALATRLPCL